MRVSIWGADLVLMAETQEEPVPFNATRAIAPHYIVSGMERRDS